MIHETLSFTDLHHLEHVLKNSILRPGHFLSPCLLLRFLMLGPLIDLLLLLLLLDSL